MRMIAWHEDQRGAVLAIVAVSLTALLGMVVLVVDVGGLLVAKRRMVTAADSAALAAAQECALAPSGGHSFATAQAQAAEVGSANGAATGKIVVTTGGCGTTAGGTVSSRFRVGERLHFAPLLGLQRDLSVSAPAKAIWGPAQGARSTPPVNLNADPGGSTFPCAVDPAHPCNFWADNSDPYNSSNSSWSFLGLEAPEWPANVAGNDPNRTCPNNDFGDVGEWTGGRPTRLIANPTYVCALNGRGGASPRSLQFIALKTMEGKTFQFPVSDPDRSVAIAGREKFAVVGFVTLKVKRVLQGIDPESYGTPAGDGECVAFPHVFFRTPPSARNFDASLIHATCALAQPGAQIGAPILRRIPGSSVFTEGSGGDYRYDPNTHVISNFSGFRPNESAVTVGISFPWHRDAQGGLCGIHAPDPNSFCIVTEWIDTQLGGLDPDPNAPDFGTRAVRLFE